MYECKPGELPWRLAGKNRHQLYLLNASEPDGETINSIKGANARKYQEHQVRLSKQITRVSHHVDVVLTVYPLAVSRIPIPPSVYKDWTKAKEYAKRGDIPSGSESDSDEPEVKKSK